MSAPTGRSPWGALAALCTGFFLIMMDTTVVAVAVPDMMRQLDADLNAITWVTSVYLLTYAAPLLITGRLGDRIGRKEVFLAGMVVFTVASLWCGLAGSVGSLVAARALQGLGAAAMTPQTMAFITVLFPAERRGTALGVWGAVAGLATTVGPLLGGLLVGLDWHWIFLVNVPIGLVGLTLTVFLVPGDLPRHGHRFDWAGTLLCGAGLLALVFGVQNGEHYGWGTIVGPVGIPVVIGAGVLLLVAFVAWQRRAPEPLMPLALFRHRGFSAATVAAAASGLALTAFYLPLTLFLQSVLGLSAAAAGVMMVPIAVGAGVTGPVAGRLSDRMAGRWVVLLGFAVFLAGIAVVALSVSPGASPFLVGAALLVCGIGTGTSFAPMANVAMGGLPGHLVGAASGTYNSTRQVASVVGSAVVSVILQVGFATAGLAREDAIALAFGLPLLVMVIGCLACLAMPDPARTGSPESPEPPEPAESTDVPAPRPHAVAASRSE